MNTKIETELNEDCSCMTPCYFCLEQAWFSDMGLEMFLREFFSYENFLKNVETGEQ